MFKNILSTKEIYGKIALLITLVWIILWVINPSSLSGDIKKIGIVEMDKLVYEFKGMKEATKIFTSKIDNWTNQSDSLKGKLKDLIYQIKLDSINQDKDKMSRDKQQFLLLQQSYYEYQQNIQQKSQSEDQQMTVGVVNQIKEYMKEYAEKYNYDLILTNTQMQNVGYVIESNDITADLLKFSNERYEGAK